MLSYSAYCRHQQTKFCVPGPDRAQSTGPGSDVDLHFDATFDDFSEDFATPGTAPGTALGQEGNEQLHGDFNNSSSDESDDLAPEIWTSSDEDCQNINSAEAAVTQVQHGRMISYVLSYFLLFFTYAITCLTGDFNTF